MSREVSSRVVFSGGVSDVVYHPTKKDAVLAVGEGGNVQLIHAKDLHTIKVFEPKPHTHRDDDEEEDEDDERLDTQHESEGDYSSCVAVHPEVTALCIVVVCVG
jgi:hypothetical protein